MLKRATITTTMLVALVATTIVVPSEANAATRLTTTSLAIRLKGSKPTKKAVRAAFSRQVQQLKVCLKGALKGKRKYTGWIWLNFRFNKAGAVRGATVSSTLGNRFADQCIKMTMNRWKLGKGAGGSITASVKIQK